MDNGASSYRRYLDGDESAFDELIGLYRSSLTLFIQRYVQDLEAAEDIAIDVFTELIVHPHRYNFKSPLKTYLYILARSRAIDFIRRRDRILMLPLESVSETPDAAPGPEELLLQQVEKNRLEQAMDALPVQMRSAVHLVYLEALSYEDAAKIMGKSKKQVSNLLYRAKSALRAMLREDGEPV